MVIIDILKAFALAFIAVFLLVLAFVVLWFVVGMSINFYKIYIKNYKISPNKCKHDRVYFRNYWFGKSTLKCNDCGTKF